MSRRNDQSGRRQEVLDPAVAALIANGERQQALRQMSKKERAEALRQAARTRVTYDIPEPVQEATGRIAAQEGISASAVVALLLADGLRRYGEGSISFTANGTKRSSRSPKYDFAVDDDVILAVLAGGRRLSPVDENASRDRWEDTPGDEANG
jgi:hypothetical protein